MVIKTKYLVMLAFLLALLALGQAGCQFLSGESETSKADIIGLDFSFVDNAPPYVLNSDLPFQVILKVDNYGTIPVFGTACVEDTVDDIYGGINKDCNSFSIKQAFKESGRVLPESKFVYFPSLSNSYSYKNLKEQPVNIVAILTYSYSTEASPLICVKDPIKKTPVRCKSSEIIPVNIKAPITITSIEKNLFRVSENLVRVNLKIHLKKLVSGSILSSPASEDYKEEFSNKINLIEASFGPYNFECDTTNGIVEIFEEKVLRCKTDVSTTGVIEHPLKIKFDYFVETKKIKNLKIE